MIEIDPKRDTPGQAHKIMHVAPDALLAEPIKGGYAKFLDIGLPLKATFFFHLQLNGQAVRIPTPASSYDILPAHPMIADNDILDDASLDMMHARTSIGCRRSLEKDKGPLAITMSMGFLHDILLIPPLHDLLFKFRERLSWIYLLKHTTSPGLATIKKSLAPTGQSLALRYHPC